MLDLQLCLLLELLASVALSLAFVVPPPFLLTTPIALPLAVALSGLLKS